MDCPQKYNRLSPFHKETSLKWEHYLKCETTARYIDHGSYEKKSNKKN